MTISYTSINLILAHISLKEGELMYICFDILVASSERDIELPKGFKLSMLS